jgi:hypothetical protein
MFQRSGREAGHAPSFHSQKQLFSEAFSYHARALKLRKLHARFCWELLNPSAVAVERFFDFRAVKLVLPPILR